MSGAYNHCRAVFGEEVASSLIHHAFRYTRNALVVAAYAPSLRRDIISTLVDEMVKVSTHRKLPLSQHRLTVPSLD